MVNEEDRLATDFHRQSNEKKKNKQSHEATKNTKGKALFIFFFLVTSVSGEN